MVPEIDGSKLETCLERYSRVSLSVIPDYRFERILLDSKYIYHFHCEIKWGAR